MSAESIRKFVRAASYEDLLQLLEDARARIKELERAKELENRPELRDPLLHAELSHILDFRTTSIDRVTNYLIPAVGRRLGWGEELTAQVTLDIKESNFDSTEDIRASLREKLPRLLKGRGGDWGLVGDDFEALILAANQDLQPEHRIEHWVFPPFIPILKLPRRPGAINRVEIETPEIIDGEPEHGSNHTDRNVLVSREGVARALGVMRKDLDGVHRPIVEKLAAFLRDLEGKSFGFFEENQAVTADVQLLMDQLGQAAECPKCGKPAKLRCRKSGRSKAGTFQFEHVIGGRTNHGGTATFPAFRLIPAPPDPRLKSTKKPAGPGSEKS